MTHEKEGNGMTAYCYLRRTLKKNTSVLLPEENIEKEHLRTTT
jgi:hypothetical protein